ncbi:MAG: thiazole synthase [Bacteroidia bacterium]|nr:thiazole synthase [Bacteroidia bacterium]
MPDVLVIAGKEFRSRLFLGTGKFSSGQVMKEAIEASGTQMVTVAFRRVDRNNKNEDILNFIPRSDDLVLLPNTSGARNAEEAVFLSELAREATGSNWIKLEIHPDPRYLMPDPVETLKAAEVLVKKGFVVLPYVHADPVLCKRLEEVGTAAVMPLGSPIGSNLGLKTLEFLQIIIEQSSVPVVVDAGIGAPSDAAKAMEIGADAVLVNTAIAVASNPVEMAAAFKKAMEAGRMARLSGLGSQSLTASASSPMEWLDEL